MDAEYRDLLHRKLDIALHPMGRIYPPSDSERLAEAIDVIAEELCSLDERLRALEVAAITEAVRAALAREGSNG